LVRAELAVAVMTETATVPLPGGDTAITSWAETTLKRAASVPKWTCFTPWKPLPRITTSVPPLFGPADGDTLETSTPVLALVRGGAVVVSVVGVVVVVVAGVVVVTVGRGVGAKPPEGGGAVVVVVELDVVDDTSSTDVNLPAWS